jgi:twitching motility protein PilT
VGPDDVDRLVDEINALTSTASSPSDSHRLEEWLSALVRRGGSDLFLVAGAPAAIRVNGDLVPIGNSPLAGDDIEDAVRPVLSSRQLDQYRQALSVDASFKAVDRVRFRLNLHRERGRAAAAIRALPTDVPQLAALNFPHSIEPLSKLARGLVLVCGSTGSGKTTTLAALVNEINRRERRHIIVIEDPIEYEHSHHRSLVEHQELGTDVADFTSALRAAMRQAPDVIVVGEMRDPDTMRLALAAAETGHLVFATLHATDTAAAVSRVVDAFAADRQGGVRQELAMALAAVLVQSLIPSANGRGRVPCAELLMVSYGARQHIRKNQLQHLNQEITITRKLGSFTLEESLAHLVQSGAVDYATAQVRAGHPDELDKLLGR